MKKAFTLLEISIVIAIILILMASISVRFWYIDHGLQTALLMEGHFSRMKSRAITHRQTLDFIIDFKQSFYYGEQQDGSLFLDPVDIPKNVKIIPVANSAFNQASVEYLKITFYPDGRCDFREYSSLEQDGTQAVQKYILRFIYGNKENWMKIDGNGALWEISSTPFPLEN